MWTAFVCSVRETCDDNLKTRCGSLPGQFSVENFLLNFSQNLKKEFVAWRW